jgi:signal peptidase I
MMEETPAPAPKESSFWDSWWSLPLLIAGIVLLRFWIVEPFKIPSGSMEPTLVGHEDYGDRIVTNKLAYVGGAQALLVSLGLLLIFVIGFVASKGWQRWRTVILTALVGIASLGGIGFAWTRGALAGDPQRFDVVVFQYDTTWAGSVTSQKINYIKRLIGLPGEEIKISGGDIFRRKNDDEPFQIIRKNEVNPGFQDSSWYPVALAWVAHNHKDISKEDARKLAFPWSGANGPGAKLEDHSLKIDGTAPVELEYLYPVTNTHIKQGRWPFKHAGCPEAHKPGRQAGGVTFSDPAQKSEHVRCYVENSWQGAQCPNCKQVLFPLNRLFQFGASNRLLPRQPEFKGRPEPEDARKVKAGGSAGDEIPDNPNDLPEVSRFFYGGQALCGDLKIELEVDVETPGRIELLAGSRLAWNWFPATNARLSDWVIGGGEMDGGRDRGVGTARVQKLVSLTPGKHRLSLAYVDATVIATLDGQVVETLPQSAAPQGRHASNFETLARVRFEGFKGTLTRLDLCRDIYYLSEMPASDLKNRMNSRQDTLRGFDGDGNYRAKIPSGFYLMLGDNSPSSSDGRIWGFVPKENLVGRASVIWWPPSRWRIIR